MNALTLRNLDRGCAEDQPRSVQPFAVQRHKNETLRHHSVF
jgi:hypothetical protein